METNIQHNTKKILELYNALRKDDLNKLLNYPPNSFATAVITKADQLGIPIKDDFMIITSGGFLYDRNDPDDVKFIQSWGKKDIKCIHAYWNNGNDKNTVSYHPHQTYVLEYDYEHYGSGTFNLIDDNSNTIGPFDPNNLGETELENAVRELPGYENAIVTEYKQETEVTLVIKTMTFENIPGIKVHQNETDIDITLTGNDYDEYSTLEKDGTNVITIKSDFFESILDSDNPSFDAGQSVRFMIYFTDNTFWIGHITVINSE